MRTSSNAPRAPEVRGGLWGAFFLLYKPFCGHLCLKKTSPTPRLWGGARTPPKPPHPRLISGAGQKATAIINPNNQITIRLLLTNPGGPLCNTFSAIALYPYPPGGGRFRSKQNPKHTGKKNQKKANLLEPPDIFENGYVLFDF